MLKYGDPCMLMVALVVFAADSEAEVVCRSRKGTLALRPACHRRETAVAPGSLGLGGGLVVRDSRGGLVGFVNGPTFVPDTTAPSDLVNIVGPFTPVVRRIGNTWVQFRVDGAGHLGYDTPSVTDFVFESNDCSGTPLVIVLPDALLSMAFMHADQVAYAILPGRSRFFQSTAFYAGSNPCPGTVLADGLCCSGGARIAKNLADTANLDLSALGLVPPFEVAEH